MALWTLKENVDEKFGFIMFLCLSPLRPPGSVCACVSLSVREEFQRVHSERNVFVNAEHARVNA